MPSPHSFTDRKLCVKARLTGALQVTMNMVKNNTTFFKVLQPALQVLKLYSANCKSIKTTSKLTKFLCYRSMKGYSANAEKNMGSGSLPFLDKSSQCCRAEEGEIANVCV